MQKRTFKFNLLDFVIIFVVLCSIAVLVFRDTIHDAFEEATPVTLEVTLEVNGEVSVSKAQSAVSKTAIFEQKIDAETVFEVDVAEVTVLPGSLTVPNRAEVTVVCIGYEKLGRFYTENGERILDNTECVLIINGESVECRVNGIEENGL